MQPPAKSAPTTSATHGAPWWIKQAIATSASVTDNMEEADVIFVYDLCYYQRWLGQVRSGAAHGLWFRRNSAGRYTASHHTCRMLSILDSLFQQC